MQSCKSSLNRQYFYRMRKELKKNSQPHYSPVKFIKQAQITLKPIHQNSLFVPFAQQRDSLGRLIKPQKEVQIQRHMTTKNSQDSDDKLYKNCTSQTCVSLSDKVNIIQEVITNSFQYKNPCQMKLYESNKIQIHKKIALPIPSTKPSRKYSGEDLYEETHANLTQPSRPRFLSYDLTHQTKTEESVIVKYQSLPRIKQSYSNIFIQEKSRKKTLEEKGEEITKKKESLAGTVKLERKDPVTKQFSQVPKQKIQLQLLKKVQNQGAPLNLQSYRRWPKLNTQIEKSNEIFLAKIRESKKLAYKIKVTLEAEEWSQS